jgi:hypothetical protein
VRFGDSGNILDAIAVPVYTTLRGYYAFGGKNRTGAGGDFTIVNLPVPALALRTGLQGGGN